MIISGYDIGPLAAAAVQMAGYTPSFSNSFSNSFKLNVTAPGQYQSQSNSLESTSQGGTGRDNKETLSQMNSRSNARISGLQLVKCCDFDIVCITRIKASRHSMKTTGSGGSAFLHATPVVHNTDSSAGAAAGAVVIITPTAVTGAAAAAVAVISSDGSGVEFLCFDTDQGVFAYFVDSNISREDSSDPDLDLGRDEDGVDEDEEVDEVEELEEEDDNWRDRESESENEEEDNFDEGEQKNFPGNNFDKNGSHRTNKTEVKRKGLKDGDKFLTPKIPTPGSMLKLLTPTVDGISLGKLL